MHKNIPCNLCECSEHRLLFKVKDLNYRTTDEEFNLVKCRQCGLIYLNPQPQDMARYYPTSYAQYVPAGKGSGFKRDIAAAFKIFYNVNNGKTATIGKKIKYLHRLLEILVQDRFFLYRIQYSRDKKILDVGCGNGSYLIGLKSLGWNAEKQLYGIDFKSPVLQELKEQEQINTMEGNFIDIDLPKNFFDVVTFRHVLEHFPDPLLALKKAYTILKSGGSILIDVPNFRSIEALLLFKDKWFAIEAPRHLYHYSPATLMGLLNKAGFIVEKIYLQKNSDSFKKSLKNYGCKNTSKHIEKYLIRNLLKVFKLFGFSGEMLCRAVKR